ncbi:stage II sporulation protein M [Bacteriovoracaceae bacterium]|nr:stage II sporulation protein M [Bacteriovoracaceae bacterium]
MEQKFQKVIDQSYDEIRELSQWVQRSNQKKNSIDDDLESFTLFDRFLSNFYYLREKLGSKNPEVKRLYSKVQYFTIQLLSSQRDKRGLKSSKGMVEIYKNVWSENIYRFYLVLAVFLVSSLMGFQVGVFGEEYVILILPQEFMELIQDRYSWFEEIRKNPMGNCISIGMNNIMVSIKVFLLGALFGIGGLGIVFYNGILIGAVFGYCYQNNMDHLLAEFVSCHGFLELSLIIASGFASIHYSKAIFQKPFSEMGQRIRKPLEESIIILMVVIFGLSIAAFLEAFISPFDYFLAEQKLIIGIGAATIFWVLTLTNLKKINIKH